MQLKELLTQAFRQLLSDATKEDMTRKKKCTMYNKENADTLIYLKRIFQKAFHFANISENPYLSGGGGGGVGGVEHKKEAYLALRGVSHTPYCGDHW